MFKITKRTALRSTLDARRPATSLPVDLSLMAEGRFVFPLLRGAGGVASFQIETNGTLLARRIVVGGLPLEVGASELTPY